MRGRCLPGPGAADGYRPRMAPRPRPEGGGELERGLLPALVAFRWAAWVWLVVLGWWERGALDRSWLALVLAGLALAVTVVDTVLLRSDPDRLLTPLVIGVELAVAVGVGVADGLAFDGTQSQAFGTVWPLAGVLAAGMAGGWRVGLAAGAVVGLGGFLGEFLETWRLDGPRDQVSLGEVSSGVLFALAGATAGLVVARLEEAEAQISAVRAREEVARTLHDGVLQTLAVVQRRATDPDLAQLARDQELDLRAFLAGTTRPHDGLDAALRHAAARFERLYGGRVEVALVDEPGDLAPATVTALGGAVAEALTNAGKHGHASHATIYVEALDDGGVFVSVKDDGSGFDPSTTIEGTGITGSIRGRLAEVGGRVEIEGRPGSGTEVRLWAGSGARR